MGGAFHLTRSILRSNVGDMAAPYKITFAVTYRCNSRCTTCSIWQREREDELSLDEIRRFFAASPSIAWMDLTGGEVFLREDFVDICHAAAELLPGLYMLHFPTNGLLTDRVVAGVERILQQPPPRLIISVSIDGPPDTHDHLRGVPGGFARTIETIRRLRDMRSKQFSIFPGMTISSGNVGMVEETVRALEAELPGFSPSDLHVNIAHESEHYYGNSGLDTSFRARALEEVRAFSRSRGRAIDPVHALERAYLRQAEKYVNTGRTPLPCQALSASCFIDPTGRILPCNADPEVVGTLAEFDYSLATAWKSDRLRVARERIRQGRCPQCWTPCEAYQTLLARLGTLTVCNLF